ncbi:MAG: porin [Thalassolituus oleivorans]|jgi:hypothetical protein|uniref:porin n=1 Tax=Thalassolituus oleivorans TaxID=187493 RepID=UPI001B772A72|nr:porin [Thalassolituus oleivorans]MBQ0728131.1 porin [Thalassolituus oleivorans]MBQ0780052.1 porin [Thalassolituus oleivorans]
MLRIKPTLLVAALTATSLAQANDIQINGFMNVTVGVSSNDEIEVDGYDESMSATNNSVVGLQFLKQVNDSTSATVQLVARGADEFNTQASWAYITYSFDENTDFRMGRLRTPLYHYSDFLEVGYAYNWVTPSSIIYLQSNLSSLNGLDLTRRFSFQSFDNYVQVYAGRYNGPLYAGGEEYATDLPSYGIVMGSTFNDFSGRISYHDATLSLDLDPTGTRGLDQLLAGAVAAETFDVIPGLSAEKFEVDHSKTKYYQTSFSYDNGSTSAIVEYTYLDHETDAFNNSAAYMIGGAQRFGEATIHLTYVATEDELESGPSGILQKNLESKENSIILGARFDYDTGTAFKIEAERHNEELTAGAKGSVGVIYRAGFSLVF